jgi:hypothetical protein
LLPALIQLEVTNYTNNPIEKRSVNTSQLSLCALWRTIGSLLPAEGNNSQIIPQRSGKVSRTPGEAQSLFVAQAGKRT